MCLQLEKLAHKRLDLVEGGLDSFRISIAIALVQAEHLERQVLDVSWQLIRLRLHPCIGVYMEIRNRELHEQFSCVHARQHAPQLSVQLLQPVGHSRQRRKHCLAHLCRLGVRQP
jgi:hypothetical protein